MRNGPAARVPFSPTPEHRRHALRSVRFEIEQVQSLLARLSTIPAADIVLRRALLDRLVVHFRTILAFLELSERTVHYTGGLRHENDDVLAIDYGFPSVPLPITGADRGELRRRRIALSYSVGDMASVRIPAAILSMAVPVLRQCAAFADHVLSSGFDQMDEGEETAWAALRHSLEIFAPRNAAPPLPAGIP